MSAQAQERSGAVDAEAADLVAVAQGPAAVDKLIAEIVRTRESAHDRERRAVAAEKKLEESELALKVARQALDRDVALARKELDKREAACAEREAALEPREARIEKFNRMIATA